MAGSVSVQSNHGFVAVKSKPTTGAGTRPPIKLNPAPSPYGYLTFRSDPAPNSQGGVAASQREAVVVLCGDEPPKITGGYAKWSVIDRPLRRGITVFQGYDPVSMTVQVRFGRWGNNGWHVDDDSGRANEDDIVRVEQMCGQGITAGPSPFIYVNSYGPLGGTNQLVPSGFQETAAQSDTLIKRTVPWPWISTDAIEWGTTTRNEHGYRIMVEATIKLMTFEQFSSPRPGSQAGGWFTVRQGRDTPLLLAEAPTSHSLFPQKVAQSIIDDPKNRKLKLKHLRQKIKHGTQVFVPSHQT